MFINWHRTGAMLLCSLLVPALSGAAPVGNAKPASAPVAASNQVVATVNGEKILRDQVVDRILGDQIARLQTTNPMFKDRQRAAAGTVGALVLKRMGSSGSSSVTVSRAEISAWIFEDKPEVLTTTVQRMIMERAIIQAAKAQGLSVTPEQYKIEFAKFLTMIRTQAKVTGSDDKVLTMVGFRKDAMGQLLIPQILAQKMAKKALETKIGHAITSADFLEARHILVSAATQPETSGVPGEAPKTDPDKEKAFTEAKTKVDAFLADIRSGKTTFEKVAAEVNPDSTKATEGKLGVFLRGSMVPEFDKAAFALEVNKVSEPVRTSFGWHLIRVDRLGKDIPQADRDKALDQALSSSVQAKVQEIMQKAKVTNTVAPPPQMSPMMGGE